MTLQNRRELRSMNRNRIRTRIMRRRKQATEQTREEVSNNSSNLGIELKTLIERKMRRRLKKTKKKKANSNKRRPIKETEEVVKANNSIEKNLETAVNTDARMRVMRTRRVPRNP